MLPSLPDAKSPGNLVFGNELVHVDPARTSAVNTLKLQPTRIFACRKDRHISCWPVSDLSARPLFRRSLGRSGHSVGECERCDQRVRAWRSNADCVQGSLRVGGWGGSARRAKSRLRRVCHAGVFCQLVHPSLNLDCLKLPRFRGHPIS
jgi:hypothetical protein